MKQGRSKYLRFFTLALLVVALGGFVWGATRFQSHKDQSSAQADACASTTCDAKVYITVNGVSGASVGLFSSPYAFGTCTNAGSTSSGTSIKGINNAYRFLTNLLGSGGASNKILCQGWQFGPPDGVRLFAYIPGYTTSFAQEGVNILGLGSGLGSIDCSKTFSGFSNCFFNFDNGTANVKVTYSLVPPSTPSLSITNPTASSLDVSWTAATAAEGSNIASYTLKRNGTTIYTGKELSKKDTGPGLSCGQTYSYQIVVSQTNNATGAVATSQATKSGSTSACSTSTPPTGGGGTGTPPTTTPPTGGGGTGTTPPTTPSGGGTSNPPATVPKTVSSKPAGGSSSGGSATIQTPDTTPPSVPGGFNGYTSEGEPGVNLGWQASTDNIGVAGYKLERSSDGGANWTVVGSNIQTTFSIDAEAQFNTTYKYRVSAFDAKANYSGFAETEVTTGGFTPNAGPQTEVTVSSDDKLVTIKIPAGALSADAVCGVDYDATLNEVPDVPDYSLAAGPYRVICKNSNGTLLSKFDKPVQVTLDTSGINNEYKNLAYYGRNNDTNAWDIISPVIDDSSSNTASFELINGTVFAVMGQPPSTPGWVTALWIIGIFIAIIFALYMSYRWYTRRQIQKQYDDYYRKSHGF